MAASMTLDEFRSYVASELGRDPASIAPEANLRDEVGLDSVEMFLLLIAVEDLGARFPEDLMPHIVTLGDAYHHLLTSSGHRP